jgi:hypothetical protein
LTAYALVFQGVYGWSPGIAGLAYFGMITGEIIAFLVVVFQNPRYVKKLKANNNIPVPEWRLPIAMVGGVLFSGGLFWYVDASLVTLSLRHALTVLQVRMDWLFWQYPLDRTCFERSAYRIRHLQHLPILTELHRRRIPYVRGFRHRSEHLYAVDLWRYLPSVRYANVQWYGYPMGEHANWVCGGAVGADAHFLLPVW